MFDEESSYFFAISDIVNPYIQEFVKNNSEN
jgi:hypothetical protein